MVGGPGAKGLGRGGAGRRAVHWEVHRVHGRSSVLDEGGKFDVSNVGRGFDQYECVARGKVGEGGGDQVGVL